LEPSVVCPNCRTEVKLTETLAAPLIEAVKRDSEAKMRLLEAGVAKREAAMRAQAEAIDAEIATRLTAERGKLAAEEAKKAAARFAGELQAKEQLLEEQTKLAAERAAKLEEAQKAQAEALRKTRELDDARRELDLTIEKRVGEKQAEIQARAKLDAEQSMQLKLQEREKTIFGMQKQIEELKRKAEQGSQQLQGEVQELQLEALLRASFPQDGVTPVPKGEFGGDTVHEVCSPLGQPCGKILWESKRTRNWSDGWLQKLRDDQRAAKADAAILVSQALPKSIEVFGQIDGVWVTSPKSAMAVAVAIRHALIEVAMARKSGEGQQGKMETMYRYLTGPRFRHRVEAIVEKFQDMQADLEKERKAMQKSWAKREQQIQTIVQATAGMWGDMQGIAGRSLPEIEGLDFESAPTIEESPQGKLRLIEAGG
jgi:hypothetical protein